VFAAFFGAATARERSFQFFPGRFIAASRNLVSMAGVADDAGEGAAAGLGFALRTAAARLESTG
jgi:hypothetical protein